MSRRRTKSLEVSLFPFLAVLLCAMGALILLLLVITHRVEQEKLARWLAQSAASDAAHEASPSAAAPPPLSPRFVALPAGTSTPDPEKDPLLPLLHQPSEAEKAAEARIAQMRRRHEALQARRDALRAEGNEVAAAAAALARQQAATKQQQAGLAAQEAELSDRQERLRKGREELAARERALDEQLATVTAEIEREQQRLDESRGKYAIFPYDTATGTRRRPVFIECTATSIRFPSEGVELSAADVIGYGTRSNPVLAAVEALVEHYDQRAGKTDRPYVLIVIREDGTESFRVAQGMLGRLREPFGYELLPSDQHVAWPAADDDARRVVRDAIDRALAQPRTHLSGGRINLAGEGGTQMVDGNGVFADADGRFRLAAVEEARGQGYLTAATNDPWRPDGSTRTGPFSTGSGSSGTSRAYGSLTGKASGGGSATRGGAFATEDGMTAREPGGSHSPRKGDSGESDAGPTGSSCPDISDVPQLASTGSARLSVERDGADAVGDPNGASAWRRSAGQGAGSSSAGTASGAAHSEIEWIPSRKSEGSGVSGTAQATGAPGAGNGRAGENISGGPPSSIMIPFPSRSQPRTRQTTAPRRWGQSSPGALIGFEKEVPIEVGYDTLTLPNGDRVRIPEGVDPADLQAVMIEAINSHVTSWGRPPDNFYWVPVVRFVVAPGGNQFHQRLATAVRKIGLSHKDEWTLNGAAGASDGGAS